MRLHRFSVLAAALALGACASSAVTSSADGDSARVELTGKNIVLADLEAGRACAAHQKAPERVSSSCIDTFCTRKEMVYACR